MTPMLTLRYLYRTILPALLLAVIVAGCSAESRKARHLERAEKYFQAGEYEKAKLEYMNVVRADPQNATAFRRMGAIWMEQGAPLRAGPFLARARDLAPTDIPNRLNLGRLYIAVGGLSEARKEAEAILTQSPGNPDGLRLLVEASRTPEELAAAEAELQKVPAKESAPLQLAAATLALKKGDLATAETALQAAIRLDPKLASAHTGLAAVRLLQRDVAKAGAEFKIAADVSPPRSTERIQYAEFKAQTGATAEATSMLKAMTAQAPDYLPAWRLLAQIAFSEKRYDEALSLLENVYKYDPDNVDSRMVEAQVLVAKGEGAKAVGVLQRLDSTYPKVLAIKLQLARANLLANKPSEATATLNDVLAIDPENVEAKLLLAEINLRAGDSQAVVNATTDVLKKRPGLMQAQMLLVDAYRLQGRFDEAAAIFREQIKASPQAAPAYLGLGVILRQKNKIGEARTAFEKVLELAPQNTIAADQLVELDIAEKAFDRALERARAGSGAGPRTASSLLMEGKVYAAQSLWDAAQQAFSKAIELDPNLPTAYDLLIATYIAANKLPEAATQLEAVVAKNPANPAALMQLGLIYEKMGEFSKAATSYEKLLSIKADFGPALNNLAYLYAEKLNQLDKAADAGRRARSLQPADASVADTLGWIVYKQGDYQEALSLLQESAGKLPDNPEVQFHLGSAAYMMGQTDVARAAFQKALENPTDFPGKDEARRRLTLVGDGGATEMPVADLESVVKAQPNDLVALTHLAEAYAKAGESAKAAATYEQALKANPKLLAPTVQLAQLYAGPLKDPTKALDLAKKARELAPNDPAVATMIGGLAFEAGNFKWSYSLFQNARGQNPDDPALLRSFAWAAYALGKVTDARQAMERLVILAPDSPEGADAKTFLSMADLDLHPENLSAAADQVSGVLSRDPNYAPALLARADLEVRQKQLDKAEQDYTALLARFPDFSPAQKPLAKLYLDEAAKRPMAYDLANAARRNFPDDPEVALILAEACYDRKEYSKVIQLSQEAKRQKTWDSRALYYLGMSQLKLEKAEGRQTLQDALRLGLPAPLEAEANGVLSSNRKQ